MFLLIIGLLVFIGIHSVSIVAEPTRDRLRDHLGEGAWKGLYSLVSLVGLVLLVYGYGEARLQPQVIYIPPPWLRHVALLLLLPVFVLLLATYLPGRIKSAVKHPMFTAIKLWALAHLLANGMLADVLLFGTFLLWAVAGRISMKRREARPLPGPAPSVLNDVIAVAAGLGLYVVFVLWGHAWLIGVAPVAMG